MGLIESGRLGARLRNRLHTWYWRARYFWYDTEGGAHARGGLIVVFALVALLDIIKLSITAYRIHAAQQPQTVEPRQWLV